MTGDRQQDVVENWNFTHIYIELLGTVRSIDIAVSSSLFLVK